jgi:hypothetical protein
MTGKFCKGTIRLYDGSLIEGKMAADPLKNKRC